MANAPMHPIGTESAMLALAALGGCASQSAANRASRRPGESRRLSPWKTDQMSEMFTTLSQYGDGVY
jgi:hypothetical protein